jgi:hypothetical protein
MSDMVHAVIDTISYSVNWICERLKRQSMQQEQQQQQVMMGKANEQTV